MYIFLVKKGRNYVHKYDHSNNFSSLIYQEISYAFLYMIYYKIFHYLFS